MKTGTVSRLILVTAITVAIASNVARAYEVPIPNRADVAFAPVVFESGNEELCANILQMVDDRFFSRETAVDIRMQASPSIVWPLSEDSSPVEKQVYEKYPKRLVTLSPPANSNSGAPYAAVWEVPHGWRGSQYFLSVFSSFEQMQVAVDAAKTNGSLEIGPQDGVSVVEGIWSVPPIFFHHGKFYLVDGYGRGMEPEARHIQVVELTEEGRGGEVCSVQLEPDEIDGHIPASLSNLVRLLDQVVGRGGQCEGSSRPNGRLRSRYSSVASTASFRPWVNRSPHLDSMATINFYLSEWSKQSLAFKTHYEEILALLIEVRQELAEHYQSTLGYDLEVASAASQEMTDWIIQSHFNFPASDGVPKSLPEYGYFLWLQDGDLGSNPDIKKRRRELRSLILNDVSYDTIAQAVDALAKSQSEEDIQLMLPIADSLNRSDVLNLFIQTGGDVDQGNMFGKTPLMVAAHLDLVDAAATLIGAGADLNKKTWATYKCPVKIDVGNRTTLFYAAENASTDLMKLLLENGADANAVDTRGWNALDYLKLSKLPDEEKTKAAELIRSYMKR